MLILIALALIGVGIWNIVVGMPVWGFALIALAVLTLIVSIEKAYRG